MRFTKNGADALINKYEYGYNKVHMKMYEQRGHDGNKGDVFAYDEFRRLKGVKINSPEPTVPDTTQFDKSWNATYDKVDNILNIVKTETGQPEPEEIVPTIEQGSDNSKLNQYTEFDGWVLEYDKNGNTTQKGMQRYTYDYRNQMVKAEDGQSTTTFKYDAFGRRIEKSSGSNTVQFYYSGFQVIEERDDTDALQKQFIHGSGIDEILRIDKYNGGTSTPYYVHTNGIGSVTAITNDSGNLVERVSYDVFGMPTFTDANNLPLDSSSIDNDILFQGRRYDKETNLYYYRARYYDPIMGRFLQTDPMGYTDSMNLYQAFGMNPVNFVDPLGLTKIDINISRFRLSSNSVIGRYNITLRELFTDVNDIRQNFIAGLRLFQRSRRITGYTLEDFWRGNRENVSCIPIGTYEADITFSGLFRTNLPELRDVPGNRNYDGDGRRQPIRIHVGNDPDNVTGCIVLGTNFNPQDDENWIGRSAPKVAELMNFINDVRDYDENRGEVTEIFVNISLDTPGLIGNFIERYRAGLRDIGVLQFMGILNEMAENTNEVLSDLEEWANNTFGAILQQDQRIYFSTKTNPWIGRRPRR